MNSIQVSAVVPFLNEEKKVDLVVETLLHHPLIDEVICVNDGSTDNSVEKLKKFHQSIILINSPTNHGKGYALAQGIKKAKGKIVVFFDADLTNLTSEHIDALIKPMLVEPIKAVLGYSTGGHFAFLFRTVTGERSYFREDLLPHLKELERTNRFSTECYLNNLFPQHLVKKVPLFKLVHLLKHEKYPPRLAAKETIKDLITITQYNVFRRRKPNSL